MRDDQIESFLKSAGWGNALRTAIPGDASFRHYERLDRSGEKAILMDAPPSTEDVRPFLAILHLLHRYQLSAPRLLAEDVEAGLLLLEDFGDDSFNRVIAEAPDSERPIYESAVTLLLDLHRHRPPHHLMAGADGCSHELKTYDRRALWEEIQLFTQWYLPHLGIDADEKRFRNLWEPLLDELAGLEHVLTLRDFHADNLFWLPERQAVQRVGLIDFQDALIGHPAYDLVSLLQDARRDIPPALEAALLSYYCAEAKDKGWLEDDALFYRHYAILGAQRAIKIIGIFARLYRRDKKPQYLSLIPRVWGLLERNLVKGRLAGLEAWLNETVPPDLRRCNLTP